MKTPRLWILVADAGRAKVLAYEKPGRPLRPLDGLMFDNELPPSRDILADRPGRSFESVGATRHAQENPTDPRRELKRMFATRLAGTLQDRLQVGDFDALAVVAPPSFMGDLRAVWPDGLRARITSELTRDLTNSPAEELQSALQDGLELPGPTR